MKSFISTSSRRLTRFLWKEGSRSSKATTGQPYHSLSPIDKVEEKAYFEALYWALQHRKEQDIKNIALTGPYGSGKSSILRTFEARYRQEFDFLNISLATFKEELKNSKVHYSKKKHQRDESKDLLRLIELSILQQIFYHEKDDKIPDSRFKKIRSFKKLHLLLIAAGVVVMLICGLSLFASNWFYAFLGLSPSPKIKNVIHYGGLGIFAAGFFTLLYRSVRLFNNIKLSKLKFRDAEIEIDKGISKSILNNHLDEILYFFEVTPYNVVVIEDLDRFEETEIFTKLRELNLLINNSKKTKKEVAFIYAVRDDMFLDKDRTKFFDFIIPVIPVINSSNSNNKLLKIVRDNQYAISEDLIDDIGLFVDDMRLLYNITNEYHLYRGLLDEKLSQDKLLSIIVYKNIFPNDFGKLSNRDGDLYRVFADKQNHVVALQQQLDQEIGELKTEIKRLSELWIKNIRELRMVYLVRYVDRLKNFSKFYQLDKEYELAEVAEDATWQLLRDKKMRYQFFLHANWDGRYSISNNLVDINFPVVDSEVDADRTYEQHAEDIERAGKDHVGLLRQQIQEKEKKKAGARHLRIKELIATGVVKINIEDKKKSLLLNVLMRSGHIDEDYLDYISIFYEGSITKEDRDFLLNVKSQLVTEFDFPLRHIDKLVPKISLADFEQPYAFNYNLLDFLVQSGKHEPQLSTVFQLLKQADEISLTFLDNYINLSGNAGALIAKLSKVWPQLLDTINSQSAYSDAQKFRYLDLIVSFVSTEDIIEVGARSCLKKMLLGNPALLSDVSEPEKLKIAIIALDLSFEDILLEDSPQTLVDFLYTQHRYGINEKMLRRMIRAKGTYDENTFDKANYSAILRSGALELIGYINASLPQYIASVYLQLKTNKLEPEESLLSLLNNESLSIEEKKEVIEKTTEQVSHLSDSRYNEIDSILLDKLRVAPLWENICHYFENNELSLTDELIIFLNHLPNAEALGEITLDYEPTGTASELAKALIQCDTLDREVFVQLARAIHTIDDAPDFSIIPETHAAILIEYALVELSPQNFMALKENYGGLQTILAEKYPSTFVANLDEYTLDTTDLKDVLRSNNFSIDQKRFILVSFDQDAVIDDSKLLTQVGRLALEYSNFSLPKKILLAILTRCLSTPERVKLFNMNFHDFQHAEVTTILKALPEPYSDIAIKGHRPLLEHGRENSYFVNNLKTLGYISKSDDEKKGIRISTFRK